MKASSIRRIDLNWYAWNFVDNHDLVRWQNNNWWKGVSRDPACLVHKFCVCFFIFLFSWIRFVRKGLMLDWARRLESKGNWSVRRASTAAKMDQTCDFTGTTNQSSERLFYLFYFQHPCFICFIFPFLVKSVLFLFYLGMFCFILGKIWNSCNTYYILMWCGDKTSPKTS